MDDSKCDDKSILEEEAWGRIQKFKGKKVKILPLSGIYIVLMKRIKLHMKW